MKSHTAFDEEFKSTYEVSRAILELLGVSEVVDRACQEPMVPPTLTDARRYVHLALISLCEWAEAMGRRQADAGLN